MIPGRMGLYVTIKYNNNELIDDDVINFLGCLNIGRYFRTMQGSKVCNSLIKLSIELLTSNAI